MYEGKKNGNWHRIQMGILTSFFKKISLGTTYSYILLTIWPKSKASVQILLLENKWSMLDVGPGHDIIEIILFVCWKINDSNGSPHPTPSIGESCMIQKWVKVVLLYFDIIKV